MQDILIATQRSYRKKDKDLGEAGNNVMMLVAFEADREGLAGAGKKVEALFMTVGDRDSKFFPKRKTNQESRHISKSWNPLWERSSTVHVYLPAAIAIALATTTVRIPLENPQLLSLLVLPNSSSPCAMILQYIREGQSTPVPARMSKDPR